ncbi:SLC13 family permease [Desertimonas flava]|uniref:SLC13 family permease n=1 Tax=Desertimonas flava TaxID=2064846 RepID=UPI000E346604|nr:SLC13 family permease [Desertimonas flava]
MSDSTTTFVILGATVVVFMVNRVPVVVVSVGSALLLWATDVISLDEATAGFGDPTVLFIAALFVVCEALDSTGVTAWVGQQLLDRAGTGRSRVLVVTMIGCALATALITANAAVAVLVPIVVMIAARVGQQPSQMLVPLAFAAHAGSLLALTGRPANVIVSDAAEDAGAGSFGFFEFAAVGFPLLLGTVAICVVLGRQLLPARPDTAAAPTDVGELDMTLRRHYRIDGADATPLFDRTYGAAEFVVAPRSSLIGVRTEAGRPNPSGELEIIAIVRGAHPRHGPTRLEAGDTLLVRGTWKALSWHAGDSDVRVVDSPDLVRRQAVPLGVGAVEAIAVLTAMVVVLATDLAPPAVAALAAAGLVVLLGVVPVERAFASINWTTVVLVAGMIPLAGAIGTSGAGEVLAGRIVDLVGGAGPHVLLIVLFVVAAGLGQFISNTATTLLVIPIALAAAAELDVAVAPVLMSINVATAAALLTPIATPANLMVMEPGGYRFHDYWKLGVVVMAWYFVVATLLVPVIWRL